VLGTNLNHALSDCQDSVKHLPVIISTSVTYLHLIWLKVLQTSWEILWKYESAFYSALCHVHSRPQRPHSFWSAPRVATSGKVQSSEDAQSNHFVFSANQICQTWLWACAEWREFGESRTSGVWLSQRSRFLVLTKRSAASGQENVSRAKISGDVIYKQ